MKRWLGLLALLALLAGAYCTKEQIPPLGAPGGVVIGEPGGPSNVEDPPECDPDCGVYGSKPNAFIWVDESVIDNTTQSGSGWTNLRDWATVGFVTTANQQADTRYPTLWNKDSRASSLAMAKAIVWRSGYTGTGVAAYPGQILLAIQKVIEDSANALQTNSGPCDCENEPLAMARNLAGYCIALDYIWEYGYNAYPSGGGISYRNRWAHFVKNMTMAKLNVSSDNCNRTDSEDHSIYYDSGKRSGNWGAWECAALAGAAASIQSCLYDSVYAESSGPSWNQAAANKRWSRADSVYKNFVGDKKFTTVAAAELTGWDSLNTIYTTSTFTPIAQQSGSGTYDGCDETVLFNGLISQECNRGRRHTDQVKIQRPIAFGGKVAMVPSGSCYYKYDISGNYDDPADYIRSIFGALSMAAYLVERTGQYALVTTRGNPPTSASLGLPDNIWLWGGEGSTGTGLLDAVSWYAHEETNEDNNSATTTWDWTESKSSWIPWIVEGILDTDLLDEQNESAGSTSSGCRFCAGTQWLQAAF